VIKKLLSYREYWGDRIAWKIGDLAGEDCYSQPVGVFQVSLDINSDTHAFYLAETDEYPPSHDFCFVFWRWGIWVAVRRND
jgi:hypothetical protein